MKLDTLLLQLGDAHWRMSAIYQQSIVQEITCNWPSAGERERPQLIQNLQTTLGNWQYGQQPVIITVPDHWCICSTHNHDATRQSRQNVLYAFEARWPVAIEDVVADYLPGKGATLGVCVELSRMSPVMTAIEKLDLNIAAISPKALMSLQQLQSVTTDTSEHHAILANCKAKHWFILKDKKPIGWQWLDCDEKHLFLQAQTHALAGIKNMNIRTSGLPDATIKRIVQLEHVKQVTQYDVDMDNNLIECVSRIATGKTRPWINLLRAPLVKSTHEQTQQRNLGLLLLAVMVLGLCVVGSLYLRGQSYQKIAHENHLAQQAIFKETFPDSRMTGDVSKRMASELRLMLDHNTVITGGQQTNDQTSALILLHESLLHLPSNMPLHVQEIRMEKNRIDLRGMASDHAQVQQIANSLRANPNLQVQTPQMTQTGNGEIQYSIIALYQPASGKGATP